MLPPWIPRGPKGNTTMGVAGKKRPMTIEERLFVDETRPDQVSHLEIDTPDRCVECVGKECARVCPSGTYVWEDEGNRIVVSFENCLECGACRIVCPYTNITWRYPMGGMGICYRYG
jgi:ferredoxin like protein